MCAAREEVRYLSFGSRRDVEFELMGSNQSINTLMFCTCTNLYMNNRKIKPKPNVTVVIKLDYYTSVIALKGIKSARHLFSCCDVLKNEPPKLSNKYIIHVRPTSLFQHFVAKLYWVGALYTIILLPALTKMPRSTSVTNGRSPGRPYGFHRKET